EEARSRNVVPLVARPFGGEFDVRRRARELADELDELEQADRVAGAASYIEGPARNLVDAPRGHAEGIDQVVDEEHVPNLLAVAIDDDGLAGEAPLDEVGHPPLILGAELPRAVDAAHSKHDGAQAEGAGVIENVLIG